MKPIAGDLEFRNEVDDGRWLSVEEARDLLTYERDVEVLGSLEDERRRQPPRDLTSAPTIGSTRGSLSRTARDRGTARLGALAG